MRYIEKSWQVFHVVAFPGAPEEQLIELRKAFFAGAAVLFKIAMGGVSDGDEITESDERFMGDISNEIEEFGVQLDREVLGLKRTPGSN
jgi:hypothetical protein